ncbi:phospholipase A1 VesT1.02-like [Daktulosphaira vitifoliae]|uniref:phospholipase A1 VesT1.02-like n=1 Tax=Daktulosphaira vitifoliae TaxID=58002 RepID=UPI0021A9EC4D|nr:phospholipase A1 VesT1.02-like [Daktulosphaira vitifoliae]
MINIIFKLSTILLSINNIVSSFNPLKQFCSFVTPNSDSVYFYLYTKNIENIAIKPDIESIKNAPFTNGSDTLNVVVHGFGSSSQMRNIIAVRRAYLNGTVERNVIMVDYSKVTGQVSSSNIVTYGIEYLQAVYCDLPIISKAIANIIEIILNTRSEIKKVHCVGHSLGSHICGEMGNLFKKNGNKIYRITALDPAEPLFKLSPKITNQCANFVDVYHTNIGHKGFTNPLGTIDFYINNAVIQPGCVKDRSYDKSLDCSHRSALLYFAKSVNDDNIMASPCPDIINIVADKRCQYLKIDDNSKNDLNNICIIKSKQLTKNDVAFGEHVPYNASGIYFLEMEELPSSGL